MSTLSLLAKASCMTKPYVSRIGGINDLQESVVKVEREPVIVNK